MKSKLRDLKGLGPESEKRLNEIGIFTQEDLESVGAITAFIKLHNECNSKPSLNFLYAMVGAIENRHWADVARNEKGRLLIEFEGHREIGKMLMSEDSKIEI